MRSVQREPIKVLFLPSVGLILLDIPGEPVRTYAWICQILGATCTVLVPIMFPENLALAKTYPFFWFRVGTARHTNYPVLCLLFGVVVMVVSQFVDKKLMAKELKGIVTDREFLEAYGDTLKSAVLIARASSAMDDEQLMHARRKILHGIRLVVHHYYDKSRMLEINACFMAGYPIDRAPTGIEGRLKFREKTRPFNSYPFVLDLLLWAEDRDYLPTNFALPVEDASDSSMRRRLLPGAPAAFALGEIVVVKDTHDLSNYFSNEGEYVDREVMKDQLDFFKEQRFRSFVSFPLEHEGEKKGVLNVQSGKPGVFVKGNEDHELVTELLIPLKAALCVLV